MGRFNWINPAKPGQSGGSNPDLMFSVSCRSNKREGARLRFSFYPELLKETGWQPGDQFVVGLSEDGDAIAVRQVESGGYKLRGPKNTSELASLSVRAPRTLIPFKAQRVMREDVALPHEGTTAVLSTPWLEAQFATNTTPVLAAEDVD